MSRRTSFLARAAATAAVVALSLSACSGGDDESPETGPGTIETSSATDPGVEVTNGDTVTTSYRGIPPDFPLEADVILGGEDAVINGSTSVDGRRETSSVLAESDLTAGEARTDAIGLLEDAGLEQLGEPPVDDVAPVAFSGDDGDLFVLLTVGEAEEGSTVNYGVDVR